MTTLKRWIQTTFDYNPTFPLSALFLLGGLVFLVQDGFVGGEGVGGAASGLGILQSYEACLLGVALLLLWPRAIAYETTAILIIANVVRYASPFFVIGLAGQNRSAAMAVTGLVIFALTQLKQVAVLRGIGLKVTKAEQRYETGLMAVVILGLPWLADSLAMKTGGDWSFATARMVQFGGWWLLAALLAPLAFGLESLEGEDEDSHEALRSRMPAAVWRGVAFFAVSLLFGNAVWIGGGTPALASLLPLTLCLFAVFGAIHRAAGHGTPAWAIHLPAGLLGLAALAPEDLLLHELPELSRPVLLFLFAPVAVGALPVLDKTRVARGLISIGVALALVPLTLLGEPRLMIGYAGLLQLIGLGLAVAHDRERTTTALSLSLLASMMIFDEGRHGLALTGLWLSVVAGAGMMLSRTKHLTAAVTAIYLVSCLAIANGAGSVGSVALVAFSGGLIVWLGRMHDRAWLGWFVAVPFTLALGVRAELRISVNPGFLLLALAFLAIPAGAFVAIRRDEQEREEAEAWHAAVFDPAEDSLAQYPEVDLEMPPELLEEDAADAVLIG